jgi:hypothetical protein
MELRCELCKHWGDSDKDKSNDSKGITIVNDIGGRRFPTMTSAQEKNVKILKNLFTSQFSCSLQSTINFSPRRLGVMVNQK